MNHHELFIKLMKKHIPLQILILILKTCLLVAVHVLNGGVGGLLSFKLSFWRETGFCLITIFVCDIHI